VIHFEDYSPDELMQIAESMIEKQSLKITKEAKGVLQKQFNQMQTDKNRPDQSVRGGAGGGNGRAVRNMVEKATRAQAVRLAQFKQTLQHDQLRDLVASDFEVKTHQLLWGW
jgi:stage V sporulation protein K